MPNESHPLEWFAEFIPLEERARRGLLPEKLTISEIAALHPWGDKFACMLLEAAMISAHRAASEWSPVENPEKWIGEGLHHGITHGFFDRILEFPDLQVDPPAADPRNGHYYLVGRGDLKDWLQEVGLWPLPEDAPLNAWWGDPPAKTKKPEEQVDGNGCILERRKERLKAWLESQRIPMDDWHHLKERHGYTGDTLYKALAEFPEFKSQQGHGNPIAKVSFERTFWNEQSIAKLEPKQEG